MTLHDRIRDFLAGSPTAVCGASSNRSKYGNKVLRCLQQHGRAAIPIHPTETAIEGATAYPTIAAATAAVGPIHAASIITPPPITERLLPQLAAAGVRHAWMQPGAESPHAIALGEQLGLSIITDACILVALGYHDH